MKKSGMSIFSGSMLWLGAAISIAEILTGALLAPLGFGLGVVAVIVGHLVGCVLLFLAGLIGAKHNASAMESVGLSFGRIGSVFFSVLNVLQLVGWTAVMIISAGDALGSVAGGLFSFGGNSLWCVLIGGLVIVWILLGLKNLGKLNNVAVIALFVLTAILGVVIFKGGSAGKIEGTISFGAALELAIAMPVSWLPLMADYTRNTDKPVKFTLASTVCYFVGSCVMYIIGLGGAVFAGSSDIVQIMMKAGLGIAAMLIVVLATVTTTFLDVYSAGESMVNIRPKWNGKIAGVAVSVVGTLIAIFVPVERYEDFLYLIGSVFVPMAVILITDAFILKKQNRHNQIDVVNAALWVVGFVVYRLFLRVDTILGSTIPVIAIVLLLCIVVNFVQRKVTKHV